MDGEHVLQAVVAGLRYVSHSLPIRAVIVRVGLFVSGASAFWALLPLVAVQRLHLGPGGYGALLGGVGTGAVFGALALPSLRARFSLDTMLNLSTAVYALCGLAVAWAPNLPVALLATLPVGVAWIAQMASFNVTAQRSAARWVQARALALYLLVFQGGLAAGSAVWGGLADGYGASWALTWGSLAVLLSTIGTLLWKLDTTDELDLTASNHWADPLPVTPPRPNDGPVLVTVECLIEPEKSDEFRGLMRQLEHVRRRDGAYAWSLYSDPEQPGHMLETFLVSSWAEHMRQHHRVSVADKALEQQVRAFHIGEGPVIVHHYLAQSMARIR